MLTILQALPDGFLEIEPARLHEILPGPTLIHLPGRQAPALFVSILLHGNETTGLAAMQQLLSGYRKRKLPRALSLFIGNVSAARAGVRRLEAQLDYNRVWSGQGNTPEHTMAREIVEVMGARRVFASVDIHNNTGLNPHYACVNHLDQRFFYLATLFSRIVVYFTHPKGTQTAAFADLCPAVTLECGKPASDGSAEHAAGFVDACLHLSHFPEHPVHKQDIDLYHTVAVVKVPEDLRFSFDGGPADIQFDPRLDHLNFREIPAGASFGRVSAGLHHCLLAVDEAGREVAERFFNIDEGELRTTRAFMPAMLTLDERAIRQDCLCYVMERLAVPG
jgi:succinylglutamate desuccinylase